VIRLEPLDCKSLKECQEFVAFVHRHYKSEIPLELDPVTSGRMHCFWAIESTTGRRAGCTAYIAKSPYLAETVKTVLDPAFRGRGLGEAISQAIEDEVKKAGFKKVFTTIYVTNLPMLFIKLKQGYIFEGFHPNHEKPGLHEYSLGKVF
jgi:GNAT superfamily N-acetyltransferase